LSWSGFKDHTGFGDGESCDWRETSMATAQSNGRAISLNEVSFSMDPVIPLEQERLEKIRRLGSSKFNYWFGYVANVSLVVWLVSHAWHGGRMGGAQFAALAILGLLSWTLAEYLLHRYVYHVWSSFLTAGHALHHARPTDLIGVPWYLTTIAIIGIFVLLSSFLHAASVGVVMGFNWLGYIFYCICHHASHHWDVKRGWLERMKRHHLAHHGHPDHNWGFTTPFWDVFFRTYLDRGRIGMPTRSSPPERSRGVQA
jgi:sterol desaturase/sphingolipid hydroxylase (fatty acid hydroxylase superfamily)